MENNSSFETVKISLDKELSGFDDNVELGAGNWISFGYIPSNVTVYFALDNNSNSKIKALQGLQIQAKHDKVYLWSVGTNTTEQMEIMHWGSDNTKLIMPPRSDFDSLNSYGALARQQMQDIQNSSTYSDTALSQMDKIFNPYYFSARALAKNNSTSITTILTKTLTSDKIKIAIFNDIDMPVNGNMYIVVKLDGEHIAQAKTRRTSSYNNFYGNSYCFAEFDNVNGSLLEIVSYVSDASLHNHYSLEEYTLK